MVEEVDVGEQNPLSKPEYDTIFSEFNKLYAKHFYFLIIFKVENLQYKLLN